MDNRTDFQSTKNAQNRTISDIMQLQSSNNQNADVVIRLGYIRTSNHKERPGLPILSRQKII